MDEGKGRDGGLGVSDKTLVGGTINRDCSPYPQCMIFNCVKMHGGVLKSKCCFYCEKKAKCSWPCLNDPEKCGKCVKPPKIVNGVKVWQD